MAILRVYKRNSTFMDLTDLVEEISSLGLTVALQKYHINLFKKKPKA
jgi:hypothetical protein